MAIHRSARLQARQQHSKDAVLPGTSSCKAPSLCHQLDDGHFMICHDQCNDWFHSNCVGITSADRWHVAKDNWQFISPRCTHPVSSQVVTDDCLSSPTVFYPSTPCVSFL